MEQIKVELMKVEHQSLLENAAANYGWTWRRLRWSSGNTKTKRTIGPIISSSPERPKYLQAGGSVFDCCDICRLWYLHVFSQVAQISWCAFVAVNVLLIWLLLGSFKKLINTQAIIISPDRKDIVGEKKICLISV